MTGGRTLALVLVASCDPALTPQCPSGQQPCGYPACFDPTTSVCCDNSNGLICSPGEDCVQETPGPFPAFACEPPPPPPYAAVVAMFGVPGYWSGSYGSGADLYHIQFQGGSAVEVVFNGQPHHVTWTGSGLDDIEFSPDPGLSLTQLAVTGPITYVSNDSFPSEITDASGTTAVVFSFFDGAP